MPELVSCARAGGGGGGAPAVAAALPPGLMAVRAGLLRAVVVLQEIFVQVLERAKGRSNPVVVAHTDPRRFQPTGVR